MLIIYSAPREVAVRVSLVGVWGPFGGRIGTPLKGPQEGEVRVYNIVILSDLYNYY